MPPVAPGIFRAYDVRGIVDDDLTEEAADLVGKAFGTEIVRKGGRSALVGRDGRLSSPKLVAALVKGIQSTGCHVVDLGQTPTPVFYFALHELVADGGIQVTGSHNPPEYNGFKICVGRQTIFGDEIQAFRTRIEQSDFESGDGRYEARGIINDYEEMVLDRVHTSRKMRVAVDSGNGVAGLVAPKIYRELGVEVEELYSEVDGTFPNHHPDPMLEEAVEDLRKKVKEEELDFGLGFDGDADRVGVIDENGEIVWGDRLTIILARDLLRRNPGATVIFDVKCSQLVDDDIRARGGNPVMWKTGHSLIKEKMREEKALLAGEMSGHLFFAENFFGHDDAIYAGAKLLEIASRHDGSFSELLADLPETFSTPEIRRESTEQAKFEVCDRLRVELARDYEVIDIDGVRAVFEGGWGLARPSNTQPVIVLRFEADSPERLAEIQEIVNEKLTRIESELGVG